jgi:hypothetical protein
MALIPEMEIGGPSGPSQVWLWSDPGLKQPKVSATEHTEASHRLDRILEVSFKTRANVR